MLTHPKGQVSLSIIILCIIILYNSFFYLYRPYDGLSVYQENPMGEIYEVVPGGPADLAGIQIGDQLLAIDSKPVDPTKIEPRYPPGLKAGDILTYMVARGGRTVDLQLTIGRYTDNLPQLATYLGVQVLSLGFWLIGLLLVIFSQHEDNRAHLLGLVFSVGGLTIAVGGASGWNSFWGANILQQVLICLLAPLIVTVHFMFPALSFNKHRKAILYFFCIVALLLSLSIVSYNSVKVSDTGEPELISRNLFRQIALGFFTISWLVSIGLLLHNYRKVVESEVRRQTGILFWGMVLGVSPFVFLTLIPYILYGQEIVGGYITILFLLILPLAYAYVIFQRKLFIIDLIINRSLVWFVLIMFILSMSVLAFTVLERLFPAPQLLPVIGGLIAALIAFSITGVSRFVQIQVDKVLYGNHYDFTTVTASLATKLAQPLDRSRLAELLTQELPSQMGVQRADLLLSDGKSLNSADPFVGNHTITLDDPFCKWLQENRLPLRSLEMLRKSSIAPTPAWKEYDWAQVLGPLVVEGKLLGVLFLGKRAAGDIYSSQDMQIIATVTEQSALAAANLLLVETMRGFAQRLVRSEEEERKRLASDLHDTVLQDIFFIKLQLTKGIYPPEMNQAFDSLITTLRQMIKDQRPPLLKQGLVLALQGLVEELSKRSAAIPKIIWHNNLSENPVLSDEQATAVYRIAQEAVNNAIKHARARSVEVVVENNGSNCLRLQVSDDGIGGLSTNGNRKLDQNHFGLLLMQERATMINADLKIHTRLGEGTSIVLEVHP